MCLHRIFGQQISDRSAVRIPIWNCGLGTLRRGKLCSFEIRGPLVIVKLHHGGLEVGFLSDRGSQFRGREKKYLDSVLTSSKEDLDASSPATSRGVHGRLDES
mmetsp:Transcript_44512/g.172680  ORF Transcript_44512/g.172680 Transcript_44512/m.172680 type:complete len:103 (-) Transcript_44512:91-399(-)